MDGRVGGGARLDRAGDGDLRRLVAVGFRAQAFGLALPIYALKMLPYLVTVAVLALTARRRGGAPAALGLPYRREERE